MTNPILNVTKNAWFSRDVNPPTGVIIKLLLDKSFRPDNDLIFEFNDNSNYLYSVLLPEIDKWLIVLYKGMDHELGHIFLEKNDSNIIGWQVKEIENEVDRCVQSKWEKIKNEYYTQ